jgi:hypothetical protein
MKNHLLTQTQHVNSVFLALLSAYKWLVCWLLQATANKLTSQHQLGKDAFSAKNDSQMFFAKTLSLAFIEVSCLTVHSYSCFSTIHEHVLALLCPFVHI